MKSYSKFFQFVLLLLMACQVQAQVSNEGKFYHPEAGYYNFGLNGGWAYQSSDIRTDFSGFGLGATFGKNLFYRPGAPLSFDLRARFLYTKSLGLDGNRSFDIQVNRALNGAEGLNYQEYPEELDVDQGFVYQNHRTDVGELSLEGVLRLNKLREETGFLVGLYGGLGLDYYLTRTDQRRGDAPYYADYANLDQNLSERQRINLLRDNILDGSFETRADGFTEGARLDFMPSLGIELGYQLTPNWAFLLGHRTTFTRNNFIDGHQFADTNNDLLHYTSLGFEWNLSPASKKPRKPEIEVRIPEFNPYVQSTRYANIRANIKYVNSAADVDFFVNNRKESFDYTTGRFSSNFTLEPGRNEIVIAASNTVGTTRKLLVITWEESNVIDVPEYNPPVDNTPPAGDAPRVRFENPAQDNFTTENTTQSVRVRIEGARTRNNIDFRVNGNNRNFNFNANSGVLTANAPLREGRNTISVRAENRFGSDEDRRVINREVRGSAPLVRINRPTNNSTVPNARVSLEARIQNITSSRDISVSLNGSNISFFDFNNGNLRETLTLREGNNTIIVRAQNRFGSDEDRVNVRYAPQTQNPEPPRVTINTPTNNSTTNQSKANLKAKITNVRNRNDIRVSVNGGAVNNFNFNSLSGQLTAVINLTNGNNTITVRALNDDGNDQESVNIRYNAGSAPTVTITNPSQNPYTSNQKVMTVKAQVQGVSSKSGIKVWLNGRNVNNFGYANGRVTAQISLAEGNNNVRIKATNAQGSDEASTNIRFNAPKNPPTVKITSPSSGAKLTNSKVRINATVTNASKGQITVLNGNKPVTNFTLTGSKLTALINVNPGNHTLLIKAQNKDGRAEDKVNYSYTRPISKPTVKITKPAKDNSTVTTARQNLLATVTGVKSKSEIQVSLNGRSLSFNYDASRKTVGAILNLRSGKNTVVVKVQNKTGSAQATRTINYRATTDIPTGKLKPKITITSVSAPATNPFEPNVARSTIIATISNISAKSDITFTFKGQVVNDFTYDVAAKRFQITVDLTQGDNPFTIEARNRAGKDTESRTITW